MANKIFCVFLMCLFSIALADQPTKDKPKPLVIPDFSQIANETKEKPKITCKDNVTGRLIEAGQPDYEQCVSGPHNREFMPRDQNVNQTFKGL